MIKIENVVLPSAPQMIFVIEGMRNPMNSWDLSDSYMECLHPEYTAAECEACECNGLGCRLDIEPGQIEIGDNDLDLMKRLAKAGTDHRKFMRMMPVYARITAPLYFWKEFDTYKIGTVSNSCSTMHKIHAREFTLDDFSTDHLIGDSVEVYTKTIIPILNAARDLYLTKQLKQDWWQMIQLLPSSYNQTRNIMLNYEVLANIYSSRKNHKLDEWVMFCDWIDTLPLTDVLF